jgi:gas vesicle protein
MTNSASMYLGVLIGALIGVIISWWIYYRQKKTAEKQDEVIKKIADLEELHYTLLEKIERLDKQNEKTLRSILRMEERFEKERVKNNEN